MPWSANTDYGPAYNDMLIFTFCISNSIGPIEKMMRIFLLKILCSLTFAPGIFQIRASLMELMEKNWKSGRSGPRGLRSTGPRDEDFQYVH